MARIVLHQARARRCVVPSHAGHVGKSLRLSPLPPNNRRCPLERAVAQSGSCLSPRVPPLPPRLPSLPAWHMGQGEAGKSVVPPGTGFSCSSLCLMSGHDSSLLIKGFLCQANPAEPAGKLLKPRLTRGPGDGETQAVEFIPEAFRNFCVRGFVQKRIVSDRGLLIIHSERLSPAGPECVCLSARRDAPALRDAPNRDGSSLS